MLIKERIIQLIEYKKLPKEEFYVKIGMTSASFRGKAKTTPINSNAIENILSEIPDLNIEWLITGDGPMLKYSAKKVEDLTKIDISFGKPIPLVTQMTAAGFGNDDFAIGESDVKDYYIVPKFKLRKIDFMIEITGSSMYPKYSSGDIIACTILRESKFIQWNRCHVIATKEQGILVKRIKEGSDNTHILAISDNKDFPPFEIPKSEITGIAIVAGVIRLE